MVIGALTCPAEKTRAVADAVRQRKQQHGLSRRFEAKWTKISPGQVGFYLSLVDLFFEDPGLRFHAIVVPDKSALSHAAFVQDRETYYYKTYFHMLKAVFVPDTTYHVYVDMKDTHSGAKERGLLDFLCNAQDGSGHPRIQRLQSVRSRQVEQIQLADILIGAVSYANRGLSSSSAKTAVVERVRQRGGSIITASTSLSAQQFNLLRWQPDPLTMK